MKRQHQEQDGAAAAAADNTAAAVTASKPLSLEYLADRSDVDDPFWGYMIRHEGRLQGFVTDLFDKMIVFDNKTHTAQVRQEGEYYVVDLDISVKKLEQDGKGTEEKDAGSDALTEEPCERGQLALPSQEKGDGTTAN